MAVLKHIASKNADYGKSLEYLMFKHTEKGIPVRDKEGNMRMRDRFILDGINCSPFSYDKECEMLNAQYHKNQKYTDIKSHHYIISFDPEDGKEGRLTAEQAQKLGLEFAGKHFPGHQILVCTHTDGHNKSGNIHVHIIFNSLRKLNVEKAPYMDRDIDCLAGYKHHLTKDYLEYLQTELMHMCRRENLRQVDLLSPARSRITDKEYRAKQQGQKKLDDLNRRITDAGMKPRNTVFQTQKQFLRDAVKDISAQVSSPKDFKNQLKEKYEILIKDRRGRYSYLHPERKKYITDRALGSDFEKEYLACIFLTNNRSKQPAPAFDPDYDYRADPVAILFVRSDLRLVTDLQTNIRAQQNAAYARKIKLTNLKEMAKTVVYIQEHGYGTEEELHRMKKQISGKIQTAKNTISHTNNQIKAINKQIHYLGQYYSAKGIQREFLKAGYKKKFREEHRDELEKYDTAVAFLRERNQGNIPSMKQLKEEKEKLNSLREELLKELTGLEKWQRELVTVTTNVETILDCKNEQVLEKSRKEPIPER